MVWITPQIVKWWSSVTACQSCITRRLDFHRQPSLTIFPTSFFFSICKYLWKREKTYFKVQYPILNLTEWIGMLKCCKTISMKLLIRDCSVQATHLLYFQGHKNTWGNCISLLYRYVTDLHSLKTMKRMLFSPESWAELHSMIKN